MTDTSFRWQLYVTAYASLLGAPLLVAPNAVIPYLGFAPTEEVWVRLTGGLLLALALTTFSIWRRRVAEMIVPTVHVRLGLIAVLVVLGALGYPPFLFLMALIVAVGVAGTLASLRKAAAG